MNPLFMLARKARLAVGVAIIRAIDDAAKLQRVQLSLFQGEVRERVNRYQEYGFTSHPLPGAQVIAIAVGGNRDHLAVVASDDPRYRKTDLAEGEVALYHHDGAYVHLKNGGAVEVEATEVIVRASTKVTITSPLCEMSGDLQVTGTVTGGKVKSVAGRDLDLHKHTAVQGGSGVSGPPQ